MTNQQAAHHYGDDPLERMTGDLIGREPLVLRVVDAILALDREAGSAVVGLTGPWGSGKTSILDAVRPLLDGHGVKVLTYSPWAYTSLESAMLGFFAELRGAFPESAEGLRPIRDAISGVMLKVAPLGRVAKMAGIDGDDVVSGLAEFVRGDRSPETLRAELVGLLRENNQRVCVVIDDVDRLEPSELLLTFRLVRFLGRLPGVNYLMAFDEQTLSDVLTRTGLVGDDLSRARAYLEKVVQLWVDVPPLSPEQQIFMLNSTLDPVIARHGTLWNDKLSERLGRLWHDCLRAYLDQPRAFKRLASQLDASWSAVTGEVDPVDFIAVTFLRTFEPDLFSMVVRRRDELVDPWADHSMNDREGSAQKWSSEVTDLKVRHPSECMLLLRQIFSPLGAGTSAELRASQRFGSYEYFDRYVSLGLKPDEVSDVQVRQAVSALQAEGDLDQLESLARLNLESLLTRLDDMLPAGLPLNGLQWLAGIYPAALEHSSARSVFGGSCRRFVESLLTKTLESVEPDTAVESVRSLLRSAATIQAGQVLVRSSIHDRSADRKLESLVTLANEAAHEITSRLARESSETQLSDWIDGRLAADLLDLSSLSTTDETRVEIWRLIEAEGSLWSLEDVLCSLVSTATRMDGTRSKVLDGLDMFAVDEFLGLERVRSSLVHPPDVAELDENDLSWDSRLRYAYKAIKNTDPLSATFKR